MKNCFFMERNELEEELKNLCVTDDVPTKNDFQPKFIVACEAYGYDCDRDMEVGKTFLLGMFSAADKYEKVIETVDGRLCGLYEGCGPLSYDDEVQRYCVVFDGEENPLIAEGRA